jgi:hypothetical protein
MDFKQQESVGNKWSSKTKWLLGLVGVVVVGGAAFAGYYFGQKQNSDRSVVYENTFPVSESPTQTASIAEPISTTPEVEYPEVSVGEPVSSTITTVSLPQNIASSIIWSEPKQIAKLGWFKKDSEVVPPEESYLITQYFQVGSFTYQGEMGKVVILQLPAEMGGPNPVYVVDFNKRLTILAKYSGGPFMFQTGGFDYYLSLFTDDAQKMLAVDYNFNIDLLNFPDIIIGSKDGQILRRRGINELGGATLKKGDVPVFIHAKFGTVYTNKSGGFYIYGAHGAQASYGLLPNFYPSDTNFQPYIIWNDRSMNSYEYSYTDNGGCGAINFISVVTSTDITLKNDLQVAGWTNNGEPIYELKDKDHRLLRSVYENSYSPGLGGKKLSYENYLASKPIIFWVDPFGRLIKLDNRRFVSPGECGKPVIYLYPEKTTNVSVKVEPKGGMTVSDPFYNSGWQVAAEPNGQLTELKSGKQYPYLFWEGRGGLYQTPERGFVFRREDLSLEIPKKLQQMGLNEKEIADFMEFWLPRMQAKPYYFVTFLGTQQMNELAPLTINPQPNTVVRILMDFTPLDNPIMVEPLNLGRTPQRRGFTVIEWGGVLR